MTAQDATPAGKGHTGSDAESMPITRLGAADHQALLELWRGAGLGSVRPRGRDSLSAFLQAEESGVEATFGARARSGVLAGCVVASHDGRKGWVNRLAVRPEFRRRGLGKALLRVAEAWLAGQGLRIVAGLIEDDNAASLELFRGAGYVVAEDLRYLSKREDDDV